MKNDRLTQIGELSDSQKQRTHIIVSGKVQGVGYRKFVFEQASKLTLCGFCKNLPSGEVEIEVEGSLETIEKLIVSLHIGPPRAKVEKVIVSSPKPPENNSDFIILI